MAEQQQAWLDRLKELPDTAVDVVLAMRELANVLAWSQVEADTHSHQPWADMEHSMTPDALIAAGSYNRWMSLVALIALPRTKHYSSRGLKTVNS
jgi:iron only hydrogenase large subunit-like protein